MPATGAVDGAQRAAFLAETQAACQRQRDAEPARSCMKCAMAARGLGRNPIRPVLRLASTRRPCSSFWPARTGAPATWRSCEASEIERARWTTRYGDIDGRFIEYRKLDRTRPPGLEDSGTPCSTATDNQPRARSRSPGSGIRLSGQVQAADLARALDESGPMPAADARALRERFSRLSGANIATYALALDGEKRPCRVRSFERGPG